LVFELFRDGREVQKGNFFSGPSWTQLHEIEHGGKTDLRIEKRKLSDFGWTIYLPTLKTAEKSVNRQSTSFGAFFAIFDSGALLNRERLEFTSFARWRHFIIHL